MTNMLYNKLQDYLNDIFKGNILDIMTSVKQFLTLYEKNHVIFY